jgi:hypothetical protein
MLGAIAGALGEARRPRLAQLAHHAQSLGPADLILFQGSKGRGAKVVPAAPSIKPVLQLNPFPVTLRPQNYADPLSSANPGGSLAALWAFRQLVDPVPVFGPFYAASLASTESVYRQIAKGARMVGDNPFVASVIAEAQRAVAEAQAYTNLDRTAGSWLPVQPMPGDWSMARDAYDDLAIDLSGPDAGNGAFTLLGDAHTDLKLHIGGSRGRGLGVSGAGGGARSQALGPGTTMREVKMKYLTVSLGRPWLNAMLFSTGGWTLAGQAPGFCSSGDPSQNAGILPLIPTELLVAVEVQVDGDWGAADKPLLAAAQAGDHSLAVGPFPIGRESHDNSIHVIGWISSFVPRSPQA